MRPVRYQNQNIRATVKREVLVELRDDGVVPSTGWVNTVLTSLAAVLIISSTGAAQQLVPLEKTPVIRTVELRGGLTLKHTANWSVAPKRFTNMYELVNVPIEKQGTASPDSRIKITSSRRLSHEEALSRLQEIAFAVGADTDAYLEIGGWPALQHARLDKRQQPNRDRKFKTEMVLRITTAIAVEDVIVRIEAILPPDADAASRATAKTMARSVAFEQTDRSPQLTEELKVLRATPVPKAQQIVQPRTENDAPAGEPRVSASASDPGVNQRIISGGNGELEIAISPDGMFVVIGRQSAWRTSSDGGQTFPTAGVIGAFDGGDPSLAYGLSGSFYYAGIDRGCQPADAAGPLGYACTGMARSDNNGVTFPLVTPAVVCPNRAAPGDPFIPGQCFPDQEHIAADRFNAGGGGDQVYSTWRNFDGVAQDPGLVCTQDSGQTWTAPIVVGAGAFPRINVGQDGFVYVVYWSGANYNIHKYTSCATGLVPIPGFPRAVVAHIDTACPFPGHDRCDQNPSSQMIAVDNNDPLHLYFVHAQANGVGNDDIFVRDSIDGGLNWRPAVTVNAAATGNRIMPWICTTGGTAFVSWYDRRNATAANNDLTEYYGGSARLVAGVLVAGADFLISTVQDPWCASGWPCGTRFTADSESCSVQPQQAGRCSISGAPCDFSDVNCPAGQTCDTSGGCPKYGDYNGNACMAGRFYTAWASATPPAGTPITPGIDIIYDGQTVQNVAPTARCKSFSDTADANCCITVNVSDIDNGSSDPNGPGDIDTLCITAVDGNNVGCVQSVQVCDDGTFASHAVTLTITDMAGESDYCDASVDVIDNTNPTIVCDSIGGPVDTNCDYLLPFSATVEDNCCVSGEDVVVTVSLLTGNATLGTPSFSKVQTNGKTVTISGTVLVSDLTSCPATVQVTVDAVDCWGNGATQCVTTADVSDVTVPVVVCPDPVTLERGDKLCNDDVQAWLDSFTATDNCATTGQVFDSAYLGLPIPDASAAGVSHTINVPVAVTIELVQLSLRATHTFVGDLIVDIEHLGTTVRVIDRPGLPATLAGCAENNYDIILGDTGSLPIENQCADDLSSPPVYSPNNALSAFDGLNSAGAWTITVIDTSGTDVGTIDGWGVILNGGLTLTNDAPECGFPPGSTTTVNFQATDLCNNTDDDCSSEITIEPFERVDATVKGSLMVFPSVEVKWGAPDLITGVRPVTQDTFIAVTNDYPADVFIHYIFVDGDDDLEVLLVGEGPAVAERAHMGWAFQNWTSKWTGNESNYFSLANGGPKGAPPFANLDSGAEGPGRPDPENSVDRVLRGFVVAWAVDNLGNEITWNHLSGSVTMVNYQDLGAWEYNAFTFSARCTEQGGEPLDCTVFDATGTCCAAEPIVGQLDLDGFQYDIGFGRLSFDFYSSGATAFTSGLNGVQLETDLTLLPLTLDLRQNNNGPTHTKATFDIWNQNEDFFSGTHHCFWCWDQILLSDIANPNSFSIGILGTDTGKARIDGVASITACDEVNCCPRGDNACAALFFTIHGFDAPICSEPASLLGVASKILGFSGAVSARAYSGRTLIGQDREAGSILADVPDGPGTLTDDPQDDGLTVQPLPKVNRLTRPEKTKVRRR